MKIEGLKLLIQAGNPIISIESTDEPRGVRMVRVTAEHLKRPLIEWSVTEGLVPWALHEAPRLAEPGKLLPALTQVRKIEYPALFLFKDLGPYAKDPQVVRYVRDLYFAPPPRMWTLILLDAVGLPQELRRLTVPFDIGWPDEAELREVVRNTFRELKRTSLYEVESKLTNREFDQVVQTLRGLTADEAARVISAAIHDDNLLDGDDLPKIMDAKRS